MIYDVWPKSKKIILTVAILILSKRRRCCEGLKVSCGCRPVSQTPRRLCIDCVVVTLSDRHFLHRTGERQHQTQPGGWIPLHTSHHEVQGRCTCCGAVRQCFEPTLTELVCVCVDSLRSPCVNKANKQQHIKAQCHVLFLALPVSITLTLRAFNKGKLLKSLCHMPLYGLPRRHATTNIFAQLS